MLLSYLAVGMYEPLYFVVRDHLYTTKQALPRLGAVASRIRHFAGI